MKNNLLQKNIPSEWKSLKVGDIGSTYSGLRSKNKSDFGHGSPFITYMNIFSNSKIDKNRFDLVNVGADENQSKVRYGDVFFTVSSETPEEVGMSSVLLDKVDNYYLNSFCFGFRLDDFGSLIPEYARYLFRGDDFRSKIIKMAQGSTRFNLSKERVISLDITLPPIKEQQKIAEILEKVDEDIVKTQKVIDATDKLKRGLMQQLFIRGIIVGFMFDTNVFDKILAGRISLDMIKGKIFITHIQEDEIEAIKDKKRKDDLEKIFFSIEKERISTESAIFGVSKFGGAKFSSGDGLLSELQNGNYKNTNDALIAETAIKQGLTLVTEDKNLLKKVQQLGGKSISTDDFLNGNVRKFKETKLGQIPEEWTALKMRDVCTVRQGLQIAISERFPEYKSGRYKYITLKSIKENAYEYIESPKQSVICTKNDVLMTRTGNTGVVVTNIDGVFHNNFFLIDFDRSKIIKDYLVYYFLRDDIKKIVLEKAGTTTIPDLNHDAFYGIDFALPSLSEQQKIAEILSTIDAKISVNKKLKEKLTQLKKGLMRDLLSGIKRV